MWIDSSCSVLICFYAVEAFNQTGRSIWQCLCLMVLVIHFTKETLSNFLRSLVVLGEIMLFFDIVSLRFANEKLITFSFEIGSGSRHILISKVEMTIYANTYPRTLAHTCIHTYIHVYTHTCMHTHPHTYTHVYTYTYMHIHIHACRE